VSPELSGTIGGALLASCKLNGLPEIPQVDDQVPPEVSLWLGIEADSGVHEPLIHSADVEDALDWALGIFNIIVNSTDVPAWTNGMSAEDFL
jgi:hypothetical protein